MNCVETISIDQQQMLVFKWEDLANIYFRKFYFHISYPKEREREREKKKTCDLLKYTKMNFAVFKMGHAVA
jgi:uncharacterized protein with von Willebrand factor type A (vWA) domain